MYMCVYIYIYIERETYVYIYIYMFVYLSERLEVGATARAGCEQVASA